MIGRNGPSYFERVKLDNQASAAEDAVRYDQFQTGLSGVQQQAADQAVPSGNVTGLGDAIQTEIDSHLVNSEEITWQPSGVGRQAKLRIRTGGAMTVTSDGVGIDTGPSGVSPYGHTHAQLHDPVTVADSTSVNLTVTGQEVTAEVIVKSGGGLTVEAEGLAVDYGPSGVAPNVHTHAQLHDAATVVTSQSVELTLSGQEITAAVRRKTNGGILEGAAGIYIDVGSGVNQVPAGNHVHAAATQLTSGFLSSTDKRKLDIAAVLTNADQSVQFSRADVFVQGEYVGGRVRWGQPMNILGVDVTAKTPPVADCELAIEVGGVVQQVFTLPGGVGEVVNYLEINPALACEADAYLRILCYSGVGDIDQEARTIDVAVSVRPAIADAPSLRINSGGDAIDPYAEDAYHNSVGSEGSTTHAIDTSGVTDPAPTGVYQTWRGKYNDSADLIYTIPGLIRGLTYDVRLHFCQNYFNSVGNEIFTIYLTGQSVVSQASYDILAYSGAKYKAVVWENQMVPDSSGEIEIRIRPQPGTSSLLNLSINGIEIIPAA